MRRSKKGSLSLSINAIVVLILAITMLGLGIGFIKNSFGGATSKLNDVSDQIEQSIIQELQESDQLLTFKSADIKLKKGEDVDRYFGVKNTGDAQAYAIEASCTSGLDSTAAGTDIEVEEFSTTGSLESGESYVGKVIITATSDAKLTTYQCKIDITDADGADYASQSFFVTVE